MAFFSQSGLSPLFLFNDYEAQNQYNPRQCPKSYKCSKPQARRSSFMPAFDVRELTHAYHLDGELPGVDQSNIEIEFTDPHTLVIKGHTERDSIDDDNHNDDASSSRSSSPAGWHQATVEDEDAASTSSADTAASNAVSHPIKNDEPHFWAKERSIGDFQRTFSFTARVDQDNVRASLKNGVLSVIVPKEAAPTPKKIRIL
ncbi:hypothetical protein PCG10_000999 [Penicillium crustosum]|uniref:SHSP domain-containing protein n=1 Tax=Penicillium crustosum TaxID=36656 RepID=A0A9P5GDK2_PENCR|nr:uncharacterized protein N7487_004095 [Penicillium crustosum]KAF7517743.1 hypothetical protein PCG10_000999 [Penicillium crustosum]KAJ5409736.1 hypothetical protein N7487_004095 [Penicillium crustosum]